MVVFELCSRDFLGTRRFACPVSPEDIVARFHAKLRNTPPQFGSSCLCEFLVIAPVAARHETANLWTLFLAREIANPDFVLLKIVAGDASN